MQNSSPTRIEFANTLRGFAALSVLVAHYFGVFWSSREAVATLTNAPILDLGMYPIPSYISVLHPSPLLNWGAYGVALFFLVSGFVIPFSLKKATWQGFCFNRLFRILPTYAVGFTITLLAIWLCSIYFGKEFPYNFKEVFIHYFPGLHALAGSSSIDGIIWTLEIEIKFYVLCAISIFLFKKYSFKVFLLPIMLFLISKWLDNRILETGNHIFFTEARTFYFASQFLIFMFIGVAFHYLYQKCFNSERILLLVTGLFALFCLLWHTGPFGVSFYQVWSYAFAVMTFIFALSYQRFFKGNRLFNFLADISYPLYVIHGVAGYVCLRLLLENKVKAYVALILTTTLALSFSWILHKYIERPSQRLGQYLASSQGVEKMKRKMLLIKLAQNTNKN